MTKYSNGKIYKLISNKTSDVYIGSCFIALCKRYAVHKNPSNECCSRKMFQVPDAIITIVLIEAMPNCQSKAELKARELHYMTITPCINVNRPFITNITIIDGDKTEWKKAYTEAYNQANATAIIERQKAYNEANRDKINAQKKKKYAEKKLKQTQSEDSSSSE